MQKAFLSLLRFFLVSNVFIAIAAAMLCFEIQYLSTGSIDIHWGYGAFIFFGTLSLYNVHRYISYHRSRLIGRTDRFTIVAELGIWVPALVIVAALSALVYGYEYAEEYKIPLLISCIISGLYVAPVLLGKRLRDIGWLKLPALALTFTVLTAWIPAQIYNLPETLSYWLCAQRFLLLMAITIPFDMRDEELDRHAGVKTIVHHLGRANCKRLAVFILLMTMLISTQLMDLGFYDLRSLLASIVVLAIAGLLIVKTPTRSNVYYYLGAMDGVLLLHGLAILAVHLEIVS